ncbi:MAG: hypothetical protein Q7U71_04820 [bacterium]|nr:hypothetical protein [bacterium]
MNQEDISPAKLDEFNRLQDSLKDKKPQVQDLLDLSRAAREAGLPKEARNDLLTAGELEPENPVVLSVISAELGPAGFNEWQEAHKKEIPFWRDMKSTLLYPASRQGIFMLGLLAVFFAVGKMFEYLFSAVLWQAPLAMTVMSRIAGGLLGMAMLLVLPGLYASITWRTALGKTGFPDWPGFGDVFANLIGPALKALAVGLWSFMPLIMTITATAQKKISPSVSLTAFTLLLGLLYFPMSFLMMVMSQKLWPSLLPSQVLDSMAKSGRDYLKLCLLFWALLLPSLPALLLWEMPLIGPVVTVFTGLYCWACSMHLLGRFYRYEKDKLKWF